MEKKLISCGCIAVICVIILIACDDLREVNNGMDIHTWIEEDTEWQTLYRYECDVTNLIGYVDIYGKIIIEPQFYWGHDFSEGLAFVKGVSGSEDETGFIDVKGNLLIPLPTALEARRFSEGLAAVCLRAWERPNRFVEGTPGPFIVIDRTGRDVFDLEFIWVRSFENGIAQVMLINGRERYIDRAGNISRQRPQS